MLVRTKRAEPKPLWLLVKERDTEAAAGVHAETFATSTATGRTMDEIAAGAPARPAELPSTPGIDAGSVKGARPASMPTRLKPQLAVAASAPPEGDDWIHEAKFDGYRLLAFSRGGSVRVMSRTGLDWTSRLPDIVGAIAERVKVDAVLDGEAVVGCSACIWAIFQPPGIVRRLRASSSMVSIGSTLSASPLAGASV